MKPERASRFHPTANHTSARRLQTSLLRADAGREVCYTTHHRSPALVRSESNMAVATHFRRAKLRDATVPRIFSFMSVSVFAACLLHSIDLHSFLPRLSFTLSFLAQAIGAGLQVLILRFVYSY